MRIYNKRFIFKQRVGRPQELGDAIEGFLKEKLTPNTTFLRYAIVEAGPARKVIEVTILDSNSQERLPFVNQAKSTKILGKTDLAVIQIIPTGVRAEIGGYIGDATPSTNLLAAASDVLITHPNVLNGGLLYTARENILYVEGYSLDQFSKGRISLAPVVSNKIGVILDSGAKEKDPRSFELAFNTINTLRAQRGIEIMDVMVTSEPVGGKAVKLKSGAMAGEIQNPKAFLEPAQRLITKGAQAIAIATFIDIFGLPPQDLELYFSGLRPDPFGGTEAIISHAISKYFSLPCAHAPILTQKEIDFIQSQKIVDPRAAGEAITPSFLGSILQGLWKAPQITRLNEPQTISIKNVGAIVIPASCLGGVPVLAAQKFNIPVLAVEDNHTLISVTNEKLGLKNVIPVRNYSEAAGEILRIKTGLSRESVRRPLAKMEEIR